MKANTTHICLALATVGLLMGGSGCALPSIEGVFDDRDFAVFDDAPEARAQVDDEVLLVFVDVDDAANTMRTVSVDLKGIDALETGVELDVGDDSFGDDRPSIDAVEGTLVTEEIPGKGTLMTVDDDAVRAVSIGGTLQLTENEGTIAGDFHVDLDDGGYLEGSFRSVEQR
jgi:hypothetical protein